MNGGAMSHLRANVSLPHDVLITEKKHGFDRKSQ